jgi:histone H3/H4
MSQTQEKDEDNNDEFFFLAIYQLLKQINCNYSISKAAMQVLQDILVDLMERIIMEVNNLCIIHHDEIVTSRQIETATKLILPKVLSQQASLRGKQAITQFQAHKHSKKGALLSHSQRAGLCFSVPIVQQQMKDILTLTVMDKTASIYLTAVLEYMCAEILDVSGKIAIKQAINKDNSKENLTVHDKDDQQQHGKITPQAMSLAIYRDDELRRLFCRCVVSHAGIRRTLFSLSQQEQ